MPLNFRETNYSSLIFFSFPMVATDHGMSFDKHNLIGLPSNVIALLIEDFQI